MSIHGFSDVGDNCHDVTTCRNFGRCRLTGGLLGECDKPGVRPYQGAAVKKESGADHGGEKTAEGSGKREVATTTEAPPVNDSFLTVETLVHLPPRQTAREGTFAWIREGGGLFFRTDVSVTGWRQAAQGLSEAEVPHAIKRFKQSIASVLDAMERTAPLEHLPGCIPDLEHEPGRCAPDCPTLYITASGRVLTDADIQALADEEERSHNEAEAVHDRSGGQDEGNSGVSGEHPLALDTLGTPPIKPHRFYYRPGTL